MASISRHDQFALHALRPNIHGTVIEGNNLTLVRWLVEPGQTTGVHHHDLHEQFTIMIEGSIEMLVGEVLVTLTAGDVCHVPALTPHGKTRALGEKRAVLIDVFQPVREDYIAAIAPAA